MYSLSIEYKIIHSEKKTKVKDKFFSEISSNKIF